VWQGVPPKKRISKERKSKQTELLSVFFILLKNSEASMNVVAGVDDSWALKMYHTKCSPGGSS
jgi:hypothetical protein